jgi:exo-beta-1,3-glucanase (GH17 family)
MHFHSLLAAFAVLNSAAAWHKGINVGAKNPDGSCKSADDWDRAFSIIKSIPPAFSSARVFASSDCNTLANAVPGALKNGVKLLAGVWTEDDTHYANEKGALLDAIARWPNWQDWLLAVSVGSEDLYRKEVGADAIAQKVYDVRGMINSKGVTAWVGHVDTWTAW